jgi:serine/threonine protein kinase
VKATGWYTMPQKVCIAMEYLPLGNLHTYQLENGVLSEASAKFVIRQVLRGLSYIHADKLAHRDIKPSVSKPWWTSVLLLPL